jgi:hypothetical protein
MPSIAWEMTYSVETDASPAFAWNYWTTIANWDDPPAEFELDGPFASGSRGTTRLPGQEPLHWLIRDVSPPQAATITLELRGAALSFHWRFEGLPDGRTRITQRVALQGENAGAYVSQVESTFPSTLPGGMNKIAAAIANSQASRKGPETKSSPGHYTR